MAQRDGLAPWKTSRDRPRVQRCDGALLHAGTAAEVLGKLIDYNPAQIMLGRNSAEEAQELISNGQCAGQYYTYTPDKRPAQGAFNAMLETQVSSSFPQSEFGKTWIRKTIKVGSCQHCWGPSHGRKEECLYKGRCRECLAVLVDLPFKGFHHACRSLIISDAKPKRKGDGNKRKAEYDLGTPADPAQAVCHQSDRRVVRANMVQRLKQTQLKRKRDEEAKVLANQKAKDDQAAIDLAAFEVSDDLIGSDLDDEDDYQPELTEAEREAQDRAIDEMQDNLDTVMAAVDDGI